LCLLVVGGVLWYQNSNKTDDNVLATSCSTLQTADSKTEVLAPYHTVVKSKLNGKFDSAKDICIWKLNGKDSGKTIPENGYCVRAGLDFYGIGKQQVNLNVTGLDCNETITINVSGLTEEQKQINLQEKVSGETAEDIKLYQQYEATKNQN
jgi:hypothetical protein